MSYSFVQYISSGTSYSVPFQYLSKGHVSAYVAGALAPFTWVSNNLIQLTSAPASGTIVEIRRSTPKDKRLVDFVDGSVLGERELDRSALQLLFIAQETVDELERALKYGPTGVFEAGGRRITNVGDPLESMDASNKRWTETKIGEALDKTASRLSFVFVEADETATFVFVEKE